MWICPSCGRSFKQVSQSHSCETFTIDHHLWNKPSDVVALYHLLAAAVGRFGDVRIEPMKSRILFRGQTVFATVLVRRRWLEVYILLPREESSDLIRKTIQVSAGRFAHELRVDDPNRIDDPLISLLREAFDLSMDRSADEPN